MLKDCISNDCCNCKVVRSHSKAYIHNPYIFYIAYSLPLKAVSIFYYQKLVLANHSAIKFYLAYTPCSISFINVECAGCQLRRSCVILPEAGQSIPANAVNQPKCSAAFSAGMDTTGMFNCLPMASAIVLNVIASSATQ